MERKEVFGKMLDFVFGPKIEGTVIMSFKDRKGDQKLIIDSGKDSQRIMVDHPKIQVYPLLSLTHAIPNYEYQPGDVYAARPKNAEIWEEGKTF